MQGIKLEDLSVQDLEIRLRAAMEDVRTAQKEFHQATAQMVLGYKKIQPKGLSPNFGKVDLSSDQSVKQQLIQKIRTAEAKAAKIRGITAKLGKASPEKFQKENMEDMSDSAAVRILQHLGATQEEIDDLLSNYLSGDEEYEEIKQTYNDYKVDQMVGVDEVKPVTNEEAIAIFMKGHQ